MNTINPKHFRILAIAPSDRGFGFAVLEGRDTLVDWGIKRVQRENKNAKSLKKAEGLIALYRPGVLVLENASAKHSLRSPRIRRLCPQIIKLAATHKLNVKLFSRDEVMKTFLPEGQGTKYAVAEIVAKRFSEELSHKLPTERKLGHSEDSRMSIFNAAALALLFRVSLKRENFQAKESHIVGKVAAVTEGEMGR
jgi:hypothetical protein